MIMLMGKGFIPGQMGGWWKESGGKGSLKAKGSFGIRMG